MKDHHGLARKLEEAIRAHVGSDFHLDSTSPEIAEGSGKTVLVGDGKRFFVKYGKSGALDRFSAEADGLVALRDADCFRTPATIDCSGDDEHAWIILEHLELHPVRTLAEGRLAAEALANLHAHQSDAFGWHRDNYIGNTPQQNDHSGNWSRFFALQRLKPQFEFAAGTEFGGELAKLGQKIIDRTPALFLDYRARPSLVHGDLWHGNIAITNDGHVASFDPAIHFGDHEVDLAMTELFGGLPDTFYATYRALWPLAEGHAERKTLYNLYHILNHLNLFGRGYLGQATRMAKQLSSMLSR
ncbi:MAG: fructosamine kinase family protein [Rhodocyclaceae bacterium]|nr:fructosamine kinase family protein [Rhodocyclaceae bacterium]